MEYPAAKIRCTPVALSRVLALSMLILLGPSNAAPAELGSPPINVIENKQYDLFVETTIVNNCSPRTRILWKPGPPNFELGVTDSFSIDVNIINPQKALIEWTEVWEWETRSSCGKDECVYPQVRVLNTPGSYKLGKNMKIKIVGPERSNSVIASTIIKSAVKKSGQLTIGTGAPTIAAPKNTKPDSRARRTSGPCAAIKGGSQKVLVGEFIMNILSRHP